MPEYKNILYCTDFSEEADLAFINALDLAQKHNAKLHILHVIHSPYHIRRDIVDEYVSEEAMDKLSSDVLEKAKEDLKQKYQPRLGGFKNCEFTTLEGVPFVEIIRFARNNAIDVIVVDSVAALVPRAELEGEIGDTHVGLQARLMSQALRKLSAAVYMGLKSSSSCMRDKSATSG